MKTILPANIMETTTPEIILVPQTNNNLKPVSALLSEAWSAYKGRSATTKMLMVWSFGLSIVTATAQFMLVGNSFSGLIGFVVGLAQVAIYIAFLYAIMDATLSAEAAYKKSISSASKWIIVLFIQIALVMLGFMLLAIPGIYLSIALYYSIIIFVAEGLEGGDALKRSKQYVDGRWWATFWRYLGVGFVTGILAFILFASIAAFFVSAVISGSLTIEEAFNYGTLVWGIIGGAFSSFFLMPFAIFYSFSLYKNARETLR